MKILIQERAVRSAVRKILLEYNVSDDGVISGAEGDPYAYKISKVDSDSITFLVVRKNQKKMNASFKVDEKNKNKPGVVRLLKAVDVNRSKFENVPNFSDTIEKLVKKQEIEKEKPKDERSSPEASGGYKIPSNLSFDKSWDQLDVRTWTTSTEDIVRAIKYEGVTYFSYGFVSVPDQKGPQKGLAVVVPYKVYRKMVEKLGSANIRLIAKDKTITRVKPKSGNFKLRIKKGNVPVLIKQGTPEIVLGTYQFDSGAPLSAEFATQVLDILGAVPVVGGVADGANVITQLSMKPPLYFGAVLSAIAAVPAIGELAAFAKIIKGAGAVSDAVRAGKTLRVGVIEAVEQAGVKNMRSVLKGRSITSYIFDAKDSIFKFLDAQAPQLDKYILGFSEKVLPKFKEFFNIVFKTYKAAKATPYGVLMSEKKKWLSLIRRGSLKLTGEFEEAVLEKALTDSGAYKAFGVVDDALSHEKKLEALLTKLPASYSKLSFDQEFALDKLSVLSKAFAPE